MSNTETSIILSNVCQKILVFSLLFLLSNVEYISNQCFQDKMETKMPKLILLETISEIWKYQCLFFMFSLLRFI